MPYAYSNVAYGVLVLNINDYAPLLLYKSINLTLATESFAFTLKPLSCLAMLGMSTLDMQSNTTLRST